MFSRQLSRQLMNRISHVLQEDGREFKCHGYRSIRFEFTLPLNDSCIDCLQCVISFFDDFYSMNTHSKLQADLHNKNQMWNIAMFLLKVNYELPDGSFQLDFTSGEIRYHYFHRCDDHLPSEEIIRDAIEDSASKYEIYGWGIAGILTGSFTTADQAFEFCKNVRLKRANALIKQLLSE